MKSIINALKKDGKPPPQRPAATFVAASDVPLAGSSRKTSAA